MHYLWSCGFLCARYRGVTRCNHFFAQLYGGIEKKGQLSGKVSEYLNEIFQVELKGTKPCPSVGPHDFHPLINKHPFAKF